MSFFLIPEGLGAVGMPCPGTDNKRSAFLVGILKIIIKLMTNRSVFTITIHWKL